MRREKKTSVANHGGTDYWQSYSDMMAALLLMFILIMVLTLTLSQRLFDEKNADLQKKQETIEEQQEKINEQKTALTDLSRLVGMKAEIIEDLKATFEKSNLSVRVDEQTGAITFDAGIFFSTGNYVLSSQGREFLQEFVPKYLSVLLSDEYREAVSEIIIEGHTDTVGEYMMNLTLSQNRAYGVAEYCLNERNHILNRSQIEYLQKILTANGRSYSSPIYDKNGNVDLAASRRVVFKFRLKDEAMIEAIQEILGGQS